MASGTGNGLGKTNAHGTSYGNGSGTGGFGEFRQQLALIGDVSSTTSTPAKEETASAPSNGSSNSQQTKAEKDFRSQEKNTLTGDAKIFPTASLLPDQKVTLSGLGKNFSGLYYVESVTIELDGSSGLTMSLGLSKNGIGDGTTQGNSKTKKETQKPKKSNDPKEKQEITPNGSSWADFQIESHNAYKPSST